MRTILSFLISVLLMQSNFSQTTDSLRLMTFNIRISFANDGENSWNLRKPVLFNSIEKLKADIICVQEATPEAIEDISAHFPNYKLYGRGRDSIHSGYNESCHIFYKNDKFSIDSSNSETFWFSKTPKIPGSKSWNTAYTRICTSVRLIEKKSHRGIYIYNNHLDHLSVEARDSSAVLLVKKIAERKYKKDIVFVTGDFNATSNEYSIQYLTSKKGGLLDVFSSTNSLTPEFPGFTFHGFTGKADARIDYIFLKKSKRISIKRCFIDHYSENGKFPSDHFPVICDFNLK